MAFDITVSQHHVRRGPNNHVLGTLQINVKDPDFEHTQDFDYVGEVNLIEIEKLNVKINVVIKEDNGKSCVTGKAIVDLLIKIEKEFDKNCEAISPS